MIWHNATPEEVLTELSSDRQNGLSDAEAAERLAEYGKNISVKDEELNLKKAITDRLKSPSLIIFFSLLIIYILRELVTARNNFWVPVAAVITLAVKEAVFIYSEYRSVNMLGGLKNRMDTSALVIRGGKERTVKAAELVPGDLIKLQSGDYVPADVRLITAEGLRCDESVLYNEKEVIAVQKDADVLFEDHTPLSARANMLYCGCHVMTGSALAVVTETGENAEIRRFVKRDKVFSHKDVQDRIADRFSGFLKIFNIAAFAGCVVLTLLGTFAVSGKTGWGKFLEALLAAVCFYIAVVPENFTARIACLLALGVKRIAKDKAIIFHPSTVEKLAGVSVICSDKTGTLTQNYMILREVYDGEKIVDLTAGTPTKDCEVVMRFGTLSCDAPGGEGSDHTETALISAASRYLNIDKNEFDSEFPRMTSIPFTPERKIKTTVNMIEGRVFAIVRGAPDMILQRCIGADDQNITKAYEEMCSRGLRVLAISYKILEDAPAEPSAEQLEYGLQFLGLFGISDRERRGVAADINLCRTAGISTVMFTGDHINTAVSSAQKMGILGPDDLSVTGEQIDELSDEELASVAQKIKVCARFSPEQRVRIVNALHENQENVLITADSAANFVPMAVADVGCAMGKTGTDVAIGNADVVVYDDSFGSIVKAIKNSRGIFANFTKYVEYYVAMCSGIFFALLFGMIFFGTAFSAELLLLGAVFTFLYPMSLGFETSDRSTMKVPPWSVGDKPFSIRRLIISAGIGLGLALPSLIVWIINRSEGYAASAAFISLIFSFIYFMFSSRSAEFFYKRIAHNRFMLAITGICAIIIIIIAATPAGIIFGLNVVGLKGWLTAVLIPLAVPVACEAVKLIGKLEK